MKIHLQLARASNGLRSQKGIRRTNPEIQNMRHSLEIILLIFITFFFFLDRIYLYLFSCLFILFVFLKNTTVTEGTRGIGDG